MVPETPLSRAAATSRSPLLANASADGLSDPSGTSDFEAISGGPVRDSVAREMTSGLRGRGRHGVQPGLRIPASPADADHSAGPVAPGTDRQDGKRRGVPLFGRHDQKPRRSVPDQPGRLRTATRQNRRANPRGAGGSESAS